MILSFVKKNKSFFKYSLWSYLDKAFVVLIPLLLPVLFSSQIDLYNKFEYIYSISIFVSVILDLGFRSYAFYGLKDCLDIEEYISTVRSAYLMLFQIMIGLSVFLVIIFYFLDWIYFFDIVIFILIRSVFLYGTYFYTVYYRLIDKPSYSFRFTLPSNILPILILLVLYIYNIELKILYVFVGQLFSLFITLVFFRVEFDFNSLFKIIKKSINFGFPIFINLILANLVSNYAKIYAYNELTDFEMYFLSINQRVTLFIFLVHSTFISYNTKNIYLSKNYSEDRSMFLKYIAFVISGIIGAFVILWIYDIYVNKHPESLINFSTLNIFLYTFCSLVGSYFESFLARCNKVYLISFVAVLSFIFYIISINFLKNNIYELTISMILYSIFTMVFIILLVMKNINLIYKK